MNFTLCYVEYEAKVSLGVQKKFYEQTKKCLWTLLADIRARVFLALREKKSDYEISSMIGHMIPVVEAHSLMLMIAKECDSSVTHEQIWDGIERSGMYVTNDRQRECWQFVVLDIASQFCDEIQTRAVTTKK